MQAGVLPRLFAGFAEPPMVRAVRLNGTTMVRKMLYYALIFLVVASVLATLGGMVGASYFRKDVPPALGGPINPPPLP